MNVLPPLPLTQRRRADLVSLGAGLMMFGAGHLLSGALSESQRPGILVLLSIVVTAATAGAVAVGLAGQRETAADWQAARLGARTGLFSAALSAGMLVLAAKLSGAEGILSIWLAAALCILPGAVCGMGGASMGFKLSAGTSPESGTRAEAPSVSSGTGGISWLALPIWGLAVCGMSAPLYLNSWQRYSPLLKIQAVPGSSAKPAEPVEPALTVAPPQPPPPPFEFTPSSELGSTKPLQWEIFAHMTLAELDGDGPLAFTADGRFVAGIASGDVVIYDIHTLRTENTWTMGFPVNALAFSPDGKQLLLVSGESPPRIGVLRSEGSRVIMLPQPRKRLVPAEQPVWLGPNDVVFLSSGAVPARLDLASLEINPAATEESWKRRSNTQLDKWTVEGQPTWPERSAWQFAAVRFATETELPEVESVTDIWPMRFGLALGIIDRTRALSRMFPSIDLAAGDRFFATPNGSMFVRCRGRRVEIFYFQPSAATPQSAWSVTMPCDLNDLQDPVIKQAVEEKALCAFAYRPLVNPLNNQVIGPDRGRVLASVRIATWQGSQALCASDLHCDDPSGEIVIADPHRWHGSRPELLRMPVPHRWWSAAKPAEFSQRSTPLPVLDNQPRVDTRFERGAVRITDIREYRPPPPSLPGPPSPAQPAVPTVPASAPAPPANDGELIHRFIIEHHRKASAGDFAGIAADYADRVEYLTKGTVTRAFIEQDARKYHEAHSRVREWSPEHMTVRKVAPGRYEAEYVLHSETVLAKDGVTSRTTVPLRLVIVMQDGKLRIVKQVRIQQPGKKP